MTLQEQANAIYVELENYDKSSRGNSAQDAQAKQQLLQSITQRIALQPELLGCIITVIYSSHSANATLFKRLKNWLNINSETKVYAPLMWQWLQLLARTPQIRNYIDSSLLKELIYLETMNIEEFVNVIGLLCSESVLREFAKDLMNEHYESLQNRDAYRKYNPSQCKRMAYFINKMRTISLIDEDTRASWNDVEFGDQGVSRSQTYETNALDFFRRLPKDKGFDALNIPVTDLISEHFKLLLANQSFSLVDLRNEQQIIYRFEANRYLKPELIDAHTSQKIVLAKDLITQIENYFNLPLDIHEDIANALILLEMQQALVTRHYYYIHTAISRMVRLDIQNSDTWYDVYALAVSAMSVPDINKYALVDVLLNALQAKFPLDTTETDSIKLYMLSSQNLELGKLLCKMRFPKAQVTHAAAEPSASDEHRDSKRSKPTI